MIYPSEKQFLTLCKKGNTIPVYKEILGDMHTPVSAYYQLAHKAKYSFLLESVEGEEKIARFSFLARNPEIILETKNHLAKITSFKGKRPKVEHFHIDKNPLNFIRQILDKYRYVELPGLPRFSGGLVGFLSYDTVRFFERLPEKVDDDLNLDDIHLMMAKDLIIFDHLNHKIKVVSNVTIDEKDAKTTITEKYRQALREIDRIIEDLRRPISMKNKIGRNRQKSIKLHFKSNCSKAHFEHMVKQAKREIRAGEIIQVVLSQRFQTKIKTDAFNIYRSLRAINPSPYMFSLKMDKLHLIGSSPELLVRSEDTVVDTRPIAGTRPRGRTEEEDDHLAKDLLADKKEKAEHIMLVDLGRNDLGRVCRQGSVHLSEFMKIERYSHVMHIVSNVKGILHPDRDELDVLQAAFPAGTVSGAPKIRAMEIIEDLESVRRGPYAGCIGYFSFSGNLDSCITIRTIVVKDNVAYIQAGAGIVADSKPAKEYQETVNKAKAQLTAIELAHNVNNE